MAKYSLESDPANYSRVSDSARVTVYKMGMDHGGWVFILAISHFVLEAALSPGSSTGLARRTVAIKSAPSGQFPQMTLAVAKREE